MTRILLAMTFTVCMAAAPHGQALAGAAKKAEEASAKAKQTENKKAEQPATKVYTNKDLPDVPPSSVTPASTTTTTTAGAVKSGASISTDEASWRSRARELRRTLADDQTKLVAAKAHFESLPEEAKGPLGTPVVEAWMKAREEISRLTAVVANDQRAISEFEDEGRRAGVPPGWLRDK
jgi:hypothetical protein